MHRRNVDRAKDPLQPTAFDPIVNLVIAIDERPRPTGEQDGRLIAADDVLREEPFRQLLSVALRILGGPGGVITMAIVE